MQDNLVVKFNIDTGMIDPNTTQLHGTKKNNVQPRLSATYALGRRTVLRSGFGIFVGPGQGEDLIQPIESDRVNTTLSTGPLLAFPINQEALVANFTNNPNNRNYQPRAYAKDYTIPEKVYQYTASLQQELGGNFAATAGYVGSQGRNLFLRSVANQITDVVTNPNPANAAFVIREFSIVQRDADGNVTGVQNPYAEIDFKTSGGRDSYNALMLSLNRRVGARRRDEHAVHARQQPRHVGRFERSEHRGQQRAHAGGVRLRGGLQQLRRPPHLQPQPALFAALRPRSEVRQRRVGADAGAARRVGSRRHRQRAQRRPGERARHTSRHPLSGLGDGTLLHRPGGGPCRGRQHAGRRRLAQRAAAGHGVRGRTRSSTTAACCS